MLSLGKPLFCVEMNSGIAKPNVLGLDAGRTFLVLSSDNTVDATLQRSSPEREEVGIGLFSLELTCVSSRGVQ